MNELGSQTFEVREVKDELLWTHSYEVQLVK